MRTDRRFPPLAVVVSSLILLAAALLFPGASLAQKDGPRPDGPPGPPKTSGSPQFQVRISGDVMVGEGAPDFELDGSHARSVRLVDYRGKWVLLVFGDRKETVAPMREVHQQLDAVGIGMLGICNEKSYFLEAYAKQSNFPFLLLADITREISDMYGLYDSKDRFVEPGFELLDPNGVVRFAILGKILPPPDVARLARYVAARP